MVRALIQCVVVLYKQRPDQAQSLSSLLEICRVHPSIAPQLGIFVQDNSPEAEVPMFADTSPSIDYLHAPSNPGLAAAYNRALAVAKDNKAEWLLLLDQDTVLDRCFLLQLFEAIQSDAAAQACAFVPELVKDGLVLSPQVVGRVFYRRLPIGFSGFSVYPLVAFNSGACLRIQSLAAIGGFPEKYWLDYLDHIVFYRLQANGGRVYVLDCQLQHCLSLQNIELEVSLDRYSNVLAAEWQFVEDTGAGSLIHRLRLLKRTLSQAFKFRNKAYARLTLQFFWRRRGTTLASQR
jgi:GT2 family glycosyltransferase